MKRKLEENTLNEVDDPINESHVPISTLKIGSRVFVPGEGPASLQKCICCSHVPESRRKCFVVYDSNKEDSHLKPTHLVEHLGEKMMLYHGTSIVNSWSIMREGFRISKDGQLGAGCYLAREEKAEKFARSSVNRGKGFGSCIFKCVVDIKNPKYIVHSKDRGDWASKGHDSVRCEKTAVSENVEWCIKDPSSVSWSAIKILGPLGDFEGEWCYKYDAKFEEKFNGEISRYLATVTAKTDKLSKQVLEINNEIKRCSDEARSILEGKNQNQIIIKNLAESKQREAEERKRKMDEEKKRQEERKRQEAYQRKIQEEQMERNRQQEKAERQRQEELEEKQRQAAEIERIKQKSRLLNERGNNKKYMLKYCDNMPTSMNDVRCVAIDGGGFVALYDSGDTSYHGISARLAERISEQKNGNIKYIAAGPEGQYFILKENGRSLWGGTPNSFDTMMEDIKNQGSLIFVCFGASDTFFARFSSGYQYWGGDIPHQIAQKSNDGVIFSDMWLSKYNGRYYYPNDYYFYRTAGGTIDFCFPQRDYLDSQFDDLLDASNRGKIRLKQVLIDEEEECYFVRHS
jgi:hypothetical protein